MSGSSVAPEPPRLINAFFCETAIVEPSGSRTYVRVSDEWVHTGDVNKDGSFVIVPFLAIVFWSRTPGTHRISLAVTRPRSARSAPQERALIFDPGLPLSGLETYFRFTAREVGLHLFDIGLNGSLCTRIPLTIEIGSASGFPLDSPGWQ